MSGMRRGSIGFYLRAAAVLLLALPVYAAEPNRLSDAESREGWRLLFDGKTMAGWEEVTGKPFPSSWAVEDGSLKALVRTGGFQDIRTTESFRSFDLRFDWKLGASGNSGVKYLVQKVDEWTNAAGRQARARGLEYQLAGDQNEDAASDPRRLAGSLYSLIAPAPSIKAKTGEFNQSRLVVNGRRVEHWLNGVKVVEFDIGRADVQELIRINQPAGQSLAANGFISLQNHSSETWFRNIKIRVLEESR
jgi:hypothetical protein